MARSRRGSFGLQPRVAPNISGQIIALAREYQAARDSQIMDAWRNGGTFEGKKVTDDMILAYWKERQNGLDPDDPKYETLKNQIMQLEYSVEQSKQDLLHVQGKISDNQYAQFFIKWAKKVPRNSEFYRTLQKDAAKLIEQGKARAKADAERAKVEAFNKFVTDTTAKDIAVADYLTNALSSLAEQTRLTVSGNGEALLTMLTDDIKSNPDKYRGLTDAIAKADPNWDGQITVGYFSSAVSSAIDGYDAIADRAHKNGFVSAYASAVQAQSGMAGWASKVNVWPVAQSYSKGEDAFLKVWNNPNASQMEKTAAANAFSQSLTELANTPGIDPGAKSMMLADAARLVGGDGGDSPSYGEALGRPGVSPEMTMQIGAWTQVKAAMEADPLAWAYAPVDKNGQFDMTGAGPIGIVPAGSIPPGAAAVMVPGADGKPVLAMVAPHDVYATNPNDPSAAPTLVGHSLSYNVGGKAITMWAYVDNDGKNHWSLTSPANEGSSLRTDAKGNVFIDPPSTAAADPVARARQLATLNPQYADQFNTLAAQMEAQLKAGSKDVSGAEVRVSAFDPKTGTTTGSVNASYKDGKFTLSLVANSLDDKGRIVGSTETPVTFNLASPGSYAYSPSRMAAGDIPGSTFSSPLLASTYVVAGTQTQDQVSKLVGDPAFQQAFLSQTMQVLGINNPYDPRIAEAWKDISMPKNAAGVPDYRIAGPSAASRSGLVYPGADVSKDAYGSKLNITFGNNTLSLPGLPSYLKDQNINATGAVDIFNQSKDFFGNLASGVGSLLPGLGAPPQTGTGSPAVSNVPPPSTTYVTPTSSAVPPGTPTTIAPVTPPPAPAPAPVRRRGGATEYDY